MRRDLLREAEQLVEQAGRRASAAVWVSSMRPAPLQARRGEVAFNIKLDMSGVHAELARAQRGLNQLRERLSRPRVVRGDRCGRRRRRP